MQPGDLLPKNTGFRPDGIGLGSSWDRSAAELLTVEVTVAVPFAAWPGDLVKLTRAGWSGNGLYRVQESTVTMGEQGYETVLTLGDPQAVL